MVGAKVLSKNPSDLLHIKEFTGLTGREVSLGAIEIRGEKIEDVSEDLAWDMDFERPFRKAELKGFPVVLPT